MQRETSADTCTVYLIIWLNKLGHRMLPVCLGVQLAAHEIKLLCSQQSVNHLATEWHIEGWGSALISYFGMCLNIRPLPPNVWIKHWQRVDSRQSTHREDQFPTCSLQWIHVFFKRMQIKVTVSQQNDGIKGWRQCSSWKERGKRGLFVVLQHEKQRNRRFTL